MECSLKEEIECDLMSYIPILAVGRLITAVGPITTEAVVVRGILAANSLVVGSTLSLRAAGVMTNTTTATTSRWRVRIGPTTLTGAIVASCAMVNVVSALTDVIVRADADVLITAIGASGAGLGQVVPHYGSCGATPPAGLTAPVTFDTTVANLVEFTFASGGATTTATFHAGIWNVVL